MTTSRFSRSLLAGACIGTLAVVGIAATPATAADADSADLSVLHAVPDTPVDVYVDGKLTLDDFTPGSLAGPLDLPTGTYTVAITASTAADAGAPVIGPIDISLEAGKSYTVAAHLKPDNTPTATLFTNDISKTAAGEGRLTVRHIAAAPAVDILAGGSPVLTNVTNPNEGVLNLAPATISTVVAATGTTAPVIGPADVQVQEGVNTIVYAWGSLEKGNLALATQTIDGLHSSPSGVPAGEAGLAADNRPDAAAGWWGGALLAALAAAGAVLIGRRTAASRR
ncbi:MULTISPECIES: DUF4397 domain-containing protein [unclassified Rathayibacter]|uniref:DUF4397 domain-containing protein n=1 Tax=unclassified Rathayibacter TaxID=2609250 RepID=UPI000CE82B4D|nr:MULTISPECIES: DUF4397 domain-containing protein [unclassified Rathayibacter]PPG48910.1 hypothetical protein C5C24_14495 [Rathayibacter sp. AY2B3]PPI22934.1 hypothetical protein C5D08_05250 [Rathayibacter sp. AY1B6]PPI27702.1 hypothetical protein C5D44_02100 [Rathayibacter sp. AY1B5]PPI37495.1 hypothetical protein C5D34_05130 [Rathayibacter sp. AY1B1]